MMHIGKVFCKRRVQAGKPPNIMPSSQVRLYAQKIEMRSDKKKDLPAKDYAKVNQMRKI